MKIEEVNEMLNYMEREGKEETEPYKSYKSILDRIYNYLNQIYKGIRKTNEKYISSVKRLESECDCSKYTCKNEREKKYEEDEDEEENEVVDLKEKKEQQREQPREEKEKEKELMLKNKKII
jgi:hypothetical protein